MTTNGNDSNSGDTIHGGWGSDDLTGTNRNDTLYGYGGDDDLYGKEGDDHLFGGDGDDDLHADSGDDFLDGGSGHDTLDAEDGNDTLYGGDGNDKLDADSGDDLVYGGTGNDTVYGDDGHDEIYGGDGDDKLIGDSGDDTIFGGYGRDTIEGDRGDDELHGDGGEDLIKGGDGNDSIYGGESRDTLYGGDGHDYIDGGDGEDYIEGGEGNDTIYGGQGQDTIYGESGDDVLYAGDTAWNRSTDTLYGGEGNDTLYSNGNQDRLYGGSGDDQFTVIADDGNLNNLEVYGGRDSGDTDHDVLDLSQFQERYPNLQMEFSNVGNNGEDGTILLKSGDGRELGRIYYKDIEEITTTSPSGAICFAPGSLIATVRGEVPVEKLRAGDRVITRDNGMQELRWIGRRVLEAAELALLPHLQPVLVRAGALGHGLPHSDLVVSPQHRMLIRSDRASLLYEESEVLVAAKDLVGMPGVERLANRSVTYLHLLFDQHEVILANGAWSESFQPGDYSMTTLDGAQRAEIHDLFPDLSTPRSLEAFGSARRSLKRHEVEVLREAGGLVNREDGAIHAMPLAHQGR